MIWDAGIKSWDDFKVSKTNPLSPNKVRSILDKIESSKEAIINDNPSHFLSLPPKERWRLFAEFKHLVAYVDIETTGLSREFDEITTGVIYDGCEIKTYVRGVNLEYFIDDIKKYPIIVTYNGQAFDIPFIEKHFGATLNNISIDLRYILSSLDISGGLKGCEKHFGLERDNLEGIDGHVAVLLWSEYIKGTKNALDTLLAYNIEDTVNLEHLMHQAYNLRINDIFNEEAYLLKIPEKQMPLFSSDLDLVKSLTSGLPSSYLNMQQQRIVQNDFSYFVSQDTVHLLNHHGE
ncbi:MAG: ribonuclease H-like domain-containing protein [Sedimenticola sp.]